MPDHQDPIRDTAVRIAGQPNSILEKRLKLDMYDAITRVKPSLAEGVSIEDDVLTGRFFEPLTAALQGIAVVKLENAISFYDRVGFRDAWLETPLQGNLTDVQVEKITNKTKPRNLHDLAYISHKHIEKILGKAEAANLWQLLKNHQPDA